MLLPCGRPVDLHVNHEQINASCHCGTQCRFVVFSTEWFSIHFRKTKVITAPIIELERKHFQRTTSQAKVILKWFYFEVETNQRWKKMSSLSLAYVGKSQHGYVFVLDWQRMFPNLFGHSIKKPSKRKIKGLWKVNEKPL